MATPPNLARKDVNAEVKIFPPLFGLVIVLFGLLLEKLYSLEMLSSQQLSLLIGLPIFAIGIALQISIIKALKRAETTPLFKKPTTVVLQKGFFSRSRNPMYLSIFLQNIGLAFILNTYWLLLLTVVLYLYIRYYVVNREEKYLEHKFGDKYREYKSKVPRWL